MEHVLTGCLIQYNKLTCIGFVVAPGAFDGCDGKSVPISNSSYFYSPAAIIGSAVLEKREDGIWYTAVLNQTEEAETMYHKIMENEESIWHIGLYADHIKREGDAITNGTIHGVMLTPSSDSASWIETIDGKAYHA